MGGKKSPGAPARFTDALAGRDITTGSKPRGHADYGLAGTVEIPGASAIQRALDAKGDESVRMANKSPVGVTAKNEMESMLGIKPRQAPAAPPARDISDLTPTRPTLSLVERLTKAGEGIIDDRVRSDLRKAVDLAEVNKALRAALGQPNDAEKGVKKWLGAIGIGRKEITEADLPDQIIEFERLTGLEKDENTLA